mgnify:FL=1
MLGVSEREVMDLSENGTIPAYKIAGVYLRFKKEQIEEYRRNFRPDLAKEGTAGKYPLGDKLFDFIYFNDFYLLCTITIIVLLVVIFKGSQSP